MLASVDRGRARVRARQRPAVPVATSDPRFDWFEYAGDDSVYKAFPAGPNDYHNPIIAGFYPDPTIIRVGDDFYAAMSSFAYFPGVPIFHSRDLVNWTQIGHVLDRPSQLNLDSAGVSRGIFAPSLSYHDGTFYMITTLVDRGGNFFVTAKNPAGPWSDPDLALGDRRHRPVVLLRRRRQDLHPEQRPAGGEAAVRRPPRDLDAGVRHGGEEARRPALGDRQRRRRPRRRSRSGSRRPTSSSATARYYLICAEGGTADQHSEVVFRSTSVHGPYVPVQGQPDPHAAAPRFGARRFRWRPPGHADFVETPNGEWWAVFLGTRNYGRDLWNTGRETFLLPVTWVDGWPVMLTGASTVPYTHRAAEPPAQPKAGRATQRKLRLPRGVRRQCARAVLG